MTKTIECGPGLVDQNLILTPIGFLYVWRMTGSRQIVTTKQDQKSWCRTRLGCNFGGVPQTQPKTQKYTAKQKVYAAEVAVSLIFWFWMDELSQQPIIIKQLRIPQASEGRRHFISADGGWTFWARPAVITVWQKTLLTENRNLITFSVVQPQ